MEIHTLTFRIAYITLSVVCMVFGMPQSAHAGTPPTFIQEAETAFDTGTSPKTTASFDVQAGDILVAYGLRGNDFVDVSISGGSLTWTLQQQIFTSTGNWTTLNVWTAVVDTNKSMTVTFTSAGGVVFGGNVLTFRGSGGVGASNSTTVSSGAPTLNITTTQADSAIVVVNGDWNAVDGASRTWRTNAGSFTEQTYTLSSGQYTVYGGYHPDSNAIGTYAVGLSAPSGQKYSIAAIEIKGTARSSLSKPPNNLGLVGYWSFNEGAGTIATDFSGNGNHGTLDNGPTWVSGRLGQGLQFNGTNQSVQTTAADNSILDITGAITISAWIKVSSPASCDGGGEFCDIFSNYNAGGDTAQYELTLENSRLKLCAGNAGFQCDYASFVPIQNTWYHVVATRDAANTATAIYINGVAQSVTQDAKVTIPTTGFGNATIGRAGSSGSQYFPGVIDEVRVYSRQLVLGEVTGLSRSGAVKFTTSSVELQKGSTLTSGLVGHWTFDGPDVTTTITDRSGNSNHGYFVGGATTSAAVGGKLGQALVFDGTDDRVSIGDNASLHSGDGTMAAWVKTNATAKSVISATNPFVTTIGFRMYAGTNGIFIYADDGTSYGLESVSAGTLADGGWHHVVAVSDTTTRVYVDGALHATNLAYGTNTGIFTTDAGITAFRIGSDVSSLAETELFNGTIDDARIYNRALSPTEIKQLYNLGRVILRP